MASWVSSLANDSLYFPEITPDGRASQCGRRVAPAAFASSGGIFGHADSQAAHAQVELETGGGAQYTV